ncbi:MAG: DEAD/DEAH box helicase, partial [Muribaculaceae bacterium]|nr:DEAD/DEAH box helicase [Muribaculaceae bacterium]
MKPLDAKELQKRFLTPARQKALAALVGDRHSCVCGAAGSSAALLLSVLPHGKAPLLVIADSQDDAGYLFHDLCRLFGEEAVAMLPSGYKRDIKYGQADPPSQILRTETLRRIGGEKSLQAVVTYPEALAERVADRNTLSSHTMRIEQGREYDITELQKWLRGEGFAEVDYVYEPGQWASRGSILDIYGFADEMPVRIDFFGDEADSIRSFDVETQLSKQKLDSYDIVANVAAANSGTPLLGYIDADTLIAMRDSRYTLERIRAVCSEEFSQSASLTGEGDASAMQQLIDPDEFASLLDRFRLIEFKAGVRSGGIPASTPDGAGLDLDCSPQGVYHKNFDMIAESFGRFMADGYTLYILSDNRAQFDRLRSIFDDRGDSISFTPVETTLHEGFVDHLTKTCVFTDHQIFDRFHKYTLRSDRARSGKVALSLKELGQIEPGDYIVHIDHGVGKFAGLLRTEVGGRMQEMIKLVYQNNDIVFVSIHALHKLSKYRGKEGVPPKINRIGSGAWQRVKERTKSKLKDIARDLIRLYAARKEEKGFAFSPDSYLQHELEASFIYEDTPDQLTATQAVKADMESERPMDRLICGDVGFGKTEIAVRAAFKAATDGKQVAVLVPTTVLAYQHYRTFSERLKEFPVRVDYLSRARSPKQTKEILADLAQGKIDIIIGTHKLIGKSVKFNDLGLLVIDEEQKFGVAVKEKLKQLKINIDTLTMSATPIP